MSNVSGRADRSGSSRGFSAVEVMIAVVVLSFLMIVGIRTFQGSRHMTRNATMKGNAQQNARNAVELATGDLRSLGFDLDVGGGQRGLVHAGPWDIIFNANIMPANDDPVAPAFPRAIDVDLAGPGVPPGAPLYVPTSSFATGAETIRYTLDSNGDGAVSGADVGDDPEEATANPRDFVLLREVYGARGDGTNGGNGEPVALLRGPLADTDGTLPQPLLTYWLDDDDDPLTAEILHGDADADGALSQAEIVALTPVAAGDLALVSRVVLRATTEDVESAGQTGPRGRSLMSSVSFRNPVRKTGIIAGTVFQDGDADGTYDPSTESPIPGVTVRLNTGQIYDTDVTGRFVFEVQAGTYTVTELDPPGFVSTTPNSYGVTLLTGSAVVYDFGDRPAMGVGTITGKVFHDIDTDGILNNGEPGLPSIVVTLHTGVSDTTDSDGVYAFAVPAGTFTVVETDSTGWTSTTPNAVEVILASDGDVAHLDFGDIPGSGLGTLKGVVFLDLDRDGLPGAVEPGVADSPVTVFSGSTVVDSTVTNGNGEYVFALPQGNYDVEQWDRDGYSSTTPNVVRNVFVRTDSTAVVDFGDILDASLNFTVVTVGQTDRALSIVSTDLSEDNKGDSDIVLGTQLSAGSNNLHVWHNKRSNSNTPITALFDPSPSFSRNASHPIPVLHRLRINADSVNDVLTGLEATSSQNISMWVTSTAGGSRGTLPTTPSAAYETSTGSSVLSLTPVTWPGTSTKGLLVGTQDGSGSGHVEVWLESGSLSYYHHDTADLHSGPSGGLGEITALEVADFDQDGLPDIVVGEVLGTHQGRLTVFLGGSGGGGGFPWDWRDGASYLVEGEVNALEAIDMREDDQNDVDLVVGTTRGPSSGVLELWLNEVVEGQALFGDPGSVGRIRSDWIDAGGEVLSLGVQPLDPDVFPDVVAGLRTAQYSGALSVFRAFGYLPSSGTEWSHSGSGEIVTVTVDDFNLDGLEDIAVGTRTALSTGELVVYFGQ